MLFLYIFIYKLIYVYTLLIFVLIVKQLQNLLIKFCLNEKLVLFRKVR